MVTQQEDRRSGLAPHSLEESISARDGALPDTTDKARARAKQVFIASARRLAGLRFKKSSGEYALERDHCDNVQSANGGGTGRLIVNSFLIAVVLPTLIGLFYYSLLASDVYVAETKLTVRVAAETDSKSSPLSGVAGALIGKIGLGQSGSSTQDSRIILDYLKSRAAIEDVGGRTTLAAYYDKSSIDWFSRLDAQEHIEELRGYWQDKVIGSVDTVSNILTLRVRAYSPEDAHSLAQRLVSSSETLINVISQRSRDDALRRAQDEVARSMAELADVRLQMLRFQQANQLIDPVENAKQISTLISTLTLERIEVESRLAVADLTGVRGRPGDRYLQSRLDAVKSQISNLENLLTGAGSSSVSMQLKDFELLKLRQEFAEQIYTLARASYEEARRNVAKQQLYLVVVVPPFMPEYPLFPRVFADTLLVFLACLVLWSIGALLVASVKDSTG